MASENNLIGCIIETKNPAIVRMMKLRGCSSAESNGAIQFSKEPKILPFKKTYRDDIKFKIIGKAQLEVVKGKFIPIDGTTAWKTTTGWEHFFVADVTIHDKKSPKKILKQAKARGVGVFSEGQNHYYGMFQVDGMTQMFYIEQWFENGTKLAAREKSEIQTDRVYEI